MFNGNAEPQGVMKIPLLQSPLSITAVLVDKALQRKIFLQPASSLIRPSLNEKNNNNNKPKPIKSTNTNRRMSHPTTLATLFGPPKQGGILQSSGFLDLQSLMALSRTCRASMIDELSLTVFIENEVSRYHGVRTMEEAIAFCRMVYRRPLLRQWFKRGYERIQVSREMLSNAKRYEVMIAQMLQAVPMEEQYQLVSKVSGFDCRTLLHEVVQSGHPLSIKTVLALFPGSELWKALDLKDNNGWTALYCAMISNRAQYVLPLLPESERLEVLCTVYYPNSFTLLHYAAYSGHVEAIETVLKLYPESERLQALNMTTYSGATVLHMIASYSDNVECIKGILSLLPVSQWRQVLNKENSDGETVLDNMNMDTRNSIMKWLSSREKSFLKRSHHNVIETTEEDDVGQKRQRT